MIFSALTDENDHSFHDVLNCRTAVACFWSLNIRSRLELMQTSFLDADISFELCLPMLQK